MWIANLNRKKSLLWKNLSCIQGVDNIPLSMNKQTYQKTKKLSKVINFQNYLSVKLQQAKRIENIRIYYP